MTQNGRDASARRRGVAGPVMGRKQVMFAYIYMGLCNAYAAERGRRLSGSCSDRVASIMTTGGAMWIRKVASETGSNGERTSLER